MIETKTHEKPITEMLPFWFVFQTILVWGMLEIQKAFWNKAIFRIQWFSLFLLFLLPFVVGRWVAQRRKFSPWLRGVVYGFLFLVWLVTNLKITTNLKWVYVFTAEQIALSFLSGTFVIGFQEISWLSHRVLFRPFVFLGLFGTSLFATLFFPYWGPVFVLVLLFLQLGFLAFWDEKQPSFGISSLGLATGLGCVVYFSLWGFQSSSRDYFLVTTARSHQQNIAVERKLKSPFYRILSNEKLYYLQERERLRESFLFPVQESQQGKSLLVLGDPSGFVSHFLAKKFPLSSLTWYPREEGIASFFQGFSLFRKKPLKNITKHTQTSENPRLPKPTSQWDTVFITEEIRPFLLSSPSRLSTFSRQLSPQGKIIFMWGKIETLDLASCFWQKMKKEGWFVRFYSSFGLDVQWLFFVLSKQPFKKEWYKRDFQGFQSLTPERMKHLILLPKDQKEELKQPCGWRRKNGK